MKKEERKKNSDGKAITNHLPQADRCSDTLRAMDILEAKTTSFLLLPPAFVAEPDIIVYRICLWRQLFWLCPLPVLCPPPACSLAGRGESAEREKEILDTCKHCSEMAKTLVCYQLYFNPKSKTLDVNNHIIKGEAYSS